MARFAYITFFCATVAVATLALGVVSLVLQSFPYWWELGVIWILLGVSLGYTAKRFWVT
jgi:uncharacterized membrane protein